MAKRSIGRRSGGRRGRSIIALTLLGFVLVSTSVIWRRSFGASQSRMVERLERQRRDLVAQRAQLERDIREAASRRRLAPVVEQRLRLRLPSDSQVIYIHRKEIPAPVRDASR